MSNQTLIYIGLFLVGLAQFLSNKFPAIKKSRDETPVHKNKRRWREVFLWCMLLLGVASQIVPSLLLEREVKDVKAAAKIKGYVYIDSTHSFESINDKLKILLRKTPENQPDLNVKVKPFITTSFPVFDTLGFANSKTGELALQLIFKNYGDDLAMIENVASVFIVKHPLSDIPKFKSSKPMPGSKRSLGPGEPVGIRMPFYFNRFPGKTDTLFFKILIQYRGLKNTKLRDANGYYYYINDGTLKLVGASDEQKAYIDLFLKKSNTRLK